MTWDASPNPLTELLQQKKSEGAVLLDLTESNPTRTGLEYPQEEILATLHDPGILRYEPDPRGLKRAREAVAEYYADRSFVVSPDHVLLTASTSEAYSYLFKLIAEPGDQLLVPRPSYPLFEYLAAVESVTVAQYPLRYDGTWHIDFAALEAAINKRTKAIVVVNPNNPTGSFLKEDERQRLDFLASARGIAILSDEVFADYEFGEDETRVVSLLRSPKTLTFAMSGLSKSCGLPQMKLGWIVAAGEGHKKAIEGLEWVADTFLSVATPVQIALPGLLRHGAKVREQIRQRTRENLAILHKCVSDQSPCHVLRTEGGWYATLQVPAIQSEEQWAIELLREDDVQVQPGYFYDFEKEAFLVLSLLTPCETFAEGIRRILARLHS